MMQAFLIAVCLLLAACGRTDPPPDCMIDEGACVRRTGNTEAVLEIAPRPVLPMRELLFTLRLTPLLRNSPLGHSRVANTPITLTLTMPGMYMGESRIALRHLGDGVYNATGVIVRCPSGGRTWRARVEGLDPFEGLGPLEGHSPLDYTFQVGR